MEADIGRGGSPAREDTRRRQEFIGGVEGTRGDAT